MENGEFFLKRALASIAHQTFQDYEIVITKEGKMAENTNAAIKKARGEIIKVLYTDDYFATPTSLEEMVAEFQGGWLVTGCKHDDGTTIDRPHIPHFTFDVAKGVNTVGSPSVLMMSNNDPLLFDENLTWVLDCDLYARLYERYGWPTVVPKFLINIGVGPHQTTNLLSDKLKSEEDAYIKQKHGETD